MCIAICSHCLISSSNDHHKKSITFQLLRNVFECAVVFILVHSRLTRWRCNDDTTSSKQSKLTTLPPKSQTGIINTATQMSGNELPWFLLKTAKDTKSFVFQLNLRFIFRCPMVIAVGDAKVAKDILKDSLSTKPPSLCQAFDDVNLGIPSIFTSNGKSWHTRRKCKWTKGDK